METIRTVIFTPYGECSLPISTKRSLDQIIIEVVKVSQSVESQLSSKRMNSQRHYVLSL